MRGALSLHGDLERLQDRGKSVGSCSASAASCMPAYLITSATFCAKDTDDSDSDSEHEESDTDRTRVASEQLMLNRSV